MRNREIERCECPDLPDYELVQEFAVQSEDARSAFLPYNRADLLASRKVITSTKCIPPINPAPNGYLEGPANQPAQFTSQAMRVLCCPIPTS